MMVTFAHLRISNNDLTEASSGGNKILSSQDSGRDTHHMDAESCQGLLSLIKKEMKPPTRHLRGIEFNWRHVKFVYFFVELMQLLFVYRKLVILLGTRNWKIRRDHIQHETNQIADFCWAYC